MSRTSPQNLAERKSPNVVREVLAFLMRHWRREAWCVAGIAISMLVATGADLLLPVYSGRLVDAVASGASHARALRAAFYAIAAMAGLGALLALARYFAFLGIVRLTVRLMTRMASDAFWRVQRFSTDWHANNFAGSIVRRITRGIWAVDLMDDTLLLALLPAVLVLIGCPLLLGWRWPAMGLLVGAGAVAYVGVSVALSLGLIAPAARLSNAQDTRMGGALADAITCNTAVKSFGAEGREDARLGKVLDKMGLANPADVDVRLAQRSRADDRAAGAADPRRRVRGVAVVARARDCRRRHLCAHQLLHRARLPARHGPAHRQPAA